MRIAIGFGWTTLVAAEMVAANVGLGQMVLNASNFLRTDIVIMGIVVIGIVAYLFDLLMKAGEKHGLKLVGGRAQNWLRQEKSYRAFGNELGPVIRGLFSDEPCIPSSGGVRWTPDLFEVFVQGKVYQRYAEQFLDPEQIDWDNPGNIQLRQDAGPNNPLGRMALRFANALFEPVWRTGHIDHVQITVSETLGVENRGAYYDHSGAMRDMLQNHLLQMEHVH